MRYEVIIAPRSLLFTSAHIICTVATYNLSVADTSASATSAALLLATIYEVTHHVVMVMIF